uniref:Uncharacterized protein n=1 Tax=Panagrolaimus davidi TaxID=227884 RepID=A0A914Q3Q2_9BILA
MGAAWSSPYLEKENAELKSKLAEALQQNPELEKLREEHANLTALLQPASEKVETLHSQLAEMEKLREELQAATEEAKQAETLKAEIAEMEKLREERANLESRLQPSTEQVETLKSQLAEALQLNPELAKLRKEQHD